MYEQEQIDTPSLTDQYEKLLDHEPKLITNLVPGNAKEQREAFLSADIRNPDHEYEKLAAIDFNMQADAVREAGNNVATHVDVKSDHVEAYEQFTQNYLKKTELMQIMHEYKHAENETEKTDLGARYMTLNVELYGEPDETTYRSLLQEKLGAITKKDLPESAAAIRDELLGMVSYDASIDKIDRFRPSTETLEWAQGAVQTMYDDMLAHVPEDQESFTVQELQAIFQDILHSQFDGAADDWKVDIEPAKSINVKSTEKRVVIPIDREPLTRDAVRKLVVHEIGIHVLRSLAVEGTDLELLRTGLNDYYDFEEGLGVVMEQALVGKFREAGMEHYITAGLAYYDSKDFRDAFEIKWRLSALDKLKDGEDLTEEATQKAKTAAYNGVMRSMRGTDELPWFKDLAYYNGSVAVWKYLEDIKGNGLLFMYSLLGKINPADETHMDAIRAAGPRK